MRNNYRSNLKSEKGGRKTVFPSHSSGILSLISSMYALMSQDNFLRKMEASTQADDVVVLSASIKNYISNLSIDFFYKAIPINLCLENWGYYCNYKKGSAYVYKTALRI